MKKPRSEREWSEWILGIESKEWIPMMAGLETTEMSSEEILEAMFSESEDDSQNSDAIREN